MAKDGELFPYICGFVGVYAGVRDINRDGSVHRGKCIISANRWHSGIASDALEAGATGESLLSNE